MRKFKLSVSLNLVGCAQERTIEFDDEDVPDDPQADRDFNDLMLEMLWDSGMIDWTFEEVEP